MREFPKRSELARLIGSVLLPAVAAFSSAGCESMEGNAKRTDQSGPVEASPFPRKTSPNQYG